MYKIEKRTIYNNNMADEVVILDGSDSLLETASLILSYSTAWESESNLIQHHTGQSVVFFNNKRIEFTRIPDALRLLAKAMVPKTHTILKWE